MVHHVVFRDGAFHDVLHAGDLVHDFLHDLLDDRAKAAGTGIALDRLAGDRVDDEYGFYLYQALNNTVKEIPDGMHYLGLSSYSLSQEELLSIQKNLDSL